MVTVSIDGVARSLAEATQGGWITEQFDRRGRDGRIPCVEVTISEANRNLHLATPTCSRSSPGGRPLTAEEEDVIELWRKHRLTELHFTPGNIQAFLRRLSQLL